MFDGLKPGQTFTFVCDFDPAVLERKFMAFFDEEQIPASTARVDTNGIDRRFMSAPGPGNRTSRCFRCGSRMFRYRSSWTTIRTEGVPA